MANARKRLDVNELKAQILTNGGWGSIFSNYGGLSEHLSLRRPTAHGPCPKTGEGKDSFRFLDDWQNTGGAVTNKAGTFPDGIELLMWLMDQSFFQVLKELDQMIGGVKISPRRARAISKKLEEQAKQYCSPKEKEIRRKRLRTNLERSVSLLGTPGETYLRNRGITMPLDFLNQNQRVMYNPSLWYKDDTLENAIKLQGLCSRVYCKDRKLLTLHRTFLTADGRKADVAKGKMLFAGTRAPTGGCIPLDNPVDTPLGKLIGVSEGLETGLSVRQATGCPMWVGISDRLMENVNCSGIDIVLIWADKDDNLAGQEAAERMKERLAQNGIKGIIYLPQMEGPGDWNDVLVNSGAEAFPQPLQPEWKVYGGDL